MTKFICGQSFAALGVVVHHDDGEGLRQGLRRQRRQRLQEVLGPSKRRKRDDDARGRALQARRADYDGDGLRHDGIQEGRAGEREGQAAKRRGGGGSGA